MKKEKEYHIALGKGDVGRYVLLPGDPGRAPKIAGYFDDSKEMAYNREYRTFTGSVTGYDGKKIKISTTSTGIGCPSTAIAVEELIKIGADTFIRIGTAGSLQKQVGLGDVVISTASVREEGTTRQYVPLSYPAVADFEVTSALVEASRKLKIKCHAGISHCKDAFYTEGNKDLPLADYNEHMWKAWYKSNVLATSMESAALFVVSSIKRVYSGEVLAIIGLTYSDAPIVKKVGVEEAIKVAIEAVKILESRRKK
ncbi:MAG: Uridine phosphorylase [Elusimicrobia bacterium ADurb.Bin231]|nr:MAG: Uridine phosphorylase [Elusimicrobia bacterium ADurb.Bin231]